MQEIEIHGLSEIDRLMRELIEEAPEKKRAFHEEVGRAALGEVRGALGSSENVVKWQGMHVGSGGGYAAVRPDTKETEANKRGVSYKHGHITNALENGHKVRPPEGHPHYRVRLKKVRVPGKHFYSQANETMKAKTLDIADDFVNEIVSKFD